MHTVQNSRNQGILACPAGLQKTTRDRINHNPAHGHAGHDHGYGCDHHGDHGGEQDRCQVRQRGEAEQRQARVLGEASRTEADLDRLCQDQESYIARIGDRVTPSAGQVRYSKRSSAPRPANRVANVGMTFHRMTVTTRPAITMIATG